MHDAAGLIEVLKEKNPFDNKINDMCLCVCVCVCDGVQEHILDLWLERHRRKNYVNFHITQIQLLMIFFCLFFFK